LRYDIITGGYKAMEKQRVCGDCIKWTKKYSSSLGDCSAKKSEKNMWAVACTDDFSPRPNKPKRR